MKYPISKNRRDRHMYRRTGFRIS